jgi:hypothetical protein
MALGRRYSTAAAIGLLVIGGFAGCSSDDDGGDAADTDVGRALTEHLVAGAAVNDEEEARCVAGVTVEAIGEDRLADLGVTPEDVTGMSTADFTDAEITTMVDAFLDCIDVRRVLARNLAADAGEEAADCLAENLPEDALRDIVRAFNFEGQELPADSEQALREVAAECGVPVD